MEEGAEGEGSPIQGQGKRNLNVIEEEKEDQEDQSRVGTANPQKVIKPQPVTNQQVQDPKSNLNTNVPTNTATNQSMNNSNTNIAQPINPTMNNQNSMGGSNEINQPTTNTTPITGLGMGLAQTIGNTAQKNTKSAPSKKK